MDDRDDNGYAARSRPSVESVAREVRQVRSDVARLEIELAQHDTVFARKDATERDLQHTAAITQERLGRMTDRLDRIDLALKALSERDATKRNLVYGAVVAAVVGLVAAAAQAGVLG